MAATVNVLEFRWNRRRRLAIRIVVASAAITVLSAITFGVNWRMRAPDSNLGLFAPSFETRVTQVAKITVSDRSQTLTIVREAQAWRLTERDGYPASTAKVQGILENLAGMEKTLALTRDPQRWSRLMLGAPESGGEAVHMQLADDRGRDLYEVLLGYREDGGVFARAPSRDESFAVRGAPDKPSSVGAWLDLTLSPFQRSDVRGVTVRPKSGAEYRLVRTAPMQDFVFAAPYDAASVVAPIGVSATAHAFDGLTPTDVSRQASHSESLEIGRVSVDGFSGLTVHLTVLVDRAKRFWITMVAEGNAALAPTIQDINARTEGWAYLISDLEAGALLTPLESLVRLAPRPMSVVPPP